MGKGAMRQGHVAGVSQGTRQYSFHFHADPGLRTVTSATKHIHACRAKGECARCVRCLQPPTMDCWHCLRYSRQKAGRLGYAAFASTPACLVRNGAVLCFSLRSCFSAAAFCLVGATACSLLTCVRGRLHACYSSCHVLRQAAKQCR